MDFVPGSLVRARGREWVVLSGADENLLLLRPLGGSDLETTGILPELEAVESAEFAFPGTESLGDHRAGRLLRDATRISTRAAAGPFRSFARIAVDPRPYQLVPLMLGLRLDPVRLLIADDVGIGKTVEAALVAREMLDRGEIKRIGVLCPPHLAEQWQRELREKFHIEAALVLSSTANRLERQCQTGESLFEVHDHVIVSLDFIKTDARRLEFVRTCPDLVIVDEAHTCADSSGGSSRHQRHRLVADLAAKDDQHLILVSATPHSGKPEAFRSLLSFLKSDFADLPDDLSGAAHEADRRSVAEHFVQRRRGDIRHFMQEDTPFPDRTGKEASYELSAAYRKLFQSVLAYARERVESASESGHRQRVHWWSVLGMLRSLASSPAAAAATFRNRAITADAETADQADELGRSLVFDDSSLEGDEVLDTVPGSDDEHEEGTSPNRKKLQAFAREAERLVGPKHDAKLEGAISEVKGLLQEGFSPIIFCKFIPTAQYVARYLRDALPAKDCVVEEVTGELPPSEREDRILVLGEKKRAGQQVVLVCTDCLSEGINLQEDFDAVLHYDLAWSPTRHEQREGRVDRYGQPRDEVRVLTYFGRDNQIDGIVLEILVQKHKKIRDALGVSVPVPQGSGAVMEAVMEGLVLRGLDEGAQELLPGFETQRNHLHEQWELAADRERRSRTMFAQETIKPEEVAKELALARAAAGSADDVADFAVEATTALGGHSTEKSGTVDFDFARTPPGLRDLFSEFPEKFSARFALPITEGTLYLSRTHPVVSGLAAYLMDTALDPIQDSPASRAGVIRTAAVDKRTTLLLCRFRFDIETRRGSGAHAEKRSEIAEEVAILGFVGRPDQAEWISEEQATALFEAKPSGNVLPEQARDFLAAVTEGQGVLRPHLDAEAKRHAEVLLDSHTRVRRAAGMKHLSYRVDAHTPVDVLGVYVYLPQPRA